MDLNLYYSYSKFIVSGMIPTVYKRDSSDLSKANQ